MSNKVFVSPGVYTSEKDLSFVTKSIGVTTLGLVGETVKGPAFQPIFVQDWGEFVNFFGERNSSKNKVTGFANYELPYVANEYLKQSNQLFVTRVLGLSGYDAGKAWAITLDAAMDDTTIVTGSTVTVNPFFSYTANTSDGSLVNLTSSDVLFQALYDDGLLNDITDLTDIGLLSTGNTITIPETFKKYGVTFSGLSGDLVLGTKITNGSYYTGIVSGSTTYYTADSFADVEDKVVALLRSRGYYDGDENLNYEVDGITYPVSFDTSKTDAAKDGKGVFVLTGSSLVSGAFKYDLSFNKTKPSYITKVLGRTNNDGKTALFVEEIFQEMFDKYYSENKINGINLSLVRYNSQLSKYKQIYQPAVTPWVVSELRGSNLLRLFRLWTISDGNAANKQFKISFTNIKLDDKEFDITVRNYYDTDSNPQVFEKFSKLSMDPTSNNYIAKRIGTLNGDFPSKSNYILVEMDDTSDTSSAIPAGFTGYPLRKYEDATVGTAVSPIVNYKLNYGSTVGNKTKKVYLGISDTASINTSIEDDLFTYKGVPNDVSVDQWTGMTKGFHMDKDADTATIDNVKIPVGGGNYFTPSYEFEVGADEFRTETGVVGTSYEKIYTRKFTLVPFGGYDGWDIYRNERTNKDTYTATGTKGVKARNNGVFSTIALSNGDNGINSDLYAYMEAIWSFRNPEAVNINVFATPGINMFDHTTIHEETIEMIEQERADSLYIATIPDVDASNDVLMAEDVVDTLDGLGYDSNYTATYWPWIQINDTYNNVYMWVPPTRDVVRNIAYTDKIKFPWFAVAGIERGNVDCIKARTKLTQEDRDILYEGRINPVTTFATDGVKIWGNKNLQVADTALNRINVRRLLLQARKLISAVSIRLLFEQNDAAVRSQFLTLVNPILDNIRTDRGLTDFKVVLEDTPESIDRGELVGKIYLKPTRALEFIILEFNVMNTGASFDNV